MQIIVRSKNKMNKNTRANFAVSSLQLNILHPIITIITGIRQRIRYTGTIKLFRQTSYVIRLKIRPIEKKYLILIIVIFSWFEAANNLTFIYHDR